MDVGSVNVNSIKIKLGKLFDMCDFLTLISPSEIFDGADHPGKYASNYVVTSTVHDNDRRGNYVFHN